jgi:hypothetical protein
VHTAGTTKHLALRAGAERWPFSEMAEMAGTPTDTAPPDFAAPEGIRASLSLQMADVDENVPRRRSARSSSLRRAEPKASPGATGGDEENPAGGGGGSADVDDDLNVRYTDVSQMTDSAMFEPAEISIDCCKGRARSAGSTGSDREDGLDRSTKSGRGFRLEAKFNESAVFERDSVEFASVEFLCMEGDKCVELVVERRGDGKGIVDMTYQTINVNVAPESYIESSGTLVILDGQFKTSFTLAIKDNPEWNVESLLDVELKVVRGECDLGDLYKARVVILNDDEFPQGVDDFDGWKLTWGFLMHNYHHLKTETHLGLVYKLAPGVCFLLQKLITSYVLNDVLTDKDKATAPLAGACVLFLLTFVLGMVADRQFVKLKLDGKAALALRTAMMSTMVQFTPEAEEEFDTGRVLKIADEQTSFAIRKTWSAIFELFENVIQLVVMCVFIFYGKYGLCSEREREREHERGLRRIITSLPPRPYHPTHLTPTSHVVQSRVRRDCGFSLVCPS